MPKSKKERKVKLRHDPLGVQLTEDKKRNDVVVSKNKKKKKSKGHFQQDEDYLSEKMSRKVLEQARAQQMDIERGSSQKPIRRKIEEDEEEEFSDAELDEGLTLQEDGYVVCDDDGDIDEADMRAMAMFMGMSGGRRTLADIIMEKIREKEERENQSNMEEEDDGLPPLDPKVVSVYTRLGEILAKYKSGKLPRAFKIIPSLTRWEDLLVLTSPDKWSAQSHWKATRIFASNFSKHSAQRFFNLILLPRVRDDIASYKKLNFHLYVSLKKALYKPSAFFKGLLIPLCEDQPSVLEAKIVCSVITKKSIPAVHSAAALMKILSLPYYGTHSIFIKTILNKKYALPYRVIDAVVDHFMQFLDESRRLPVIWHQSLLVFAQRYKKDITAEQKEQLKLLFKRQQHYQITNEIRRELFSSLSRGQVEKQKSNTSSSSMELC